MGSIKGILNTNSDGIGIPTTQSQHGVSFLRCQDGAIASSDSRYDVNASPNESPSLAATACRSLRNSMNRTSSPPSRDSINRPSTPPPPGSTKISAQNKSFSSAFQPDRVIKLPFPADPDQPPRSRPIRRCSMVEMQQMKEAKVKTSKVNPPDRRKSDGDDFDKDRQGKCQTHCVARQDYQLGDLARCPSHMIIKPCPQSALEKASQLQNYDFAFIRRTDESWTYAILAKNHLPSSDSNEEYMIFVMNTRGSTKIIKKKLWASYVRCVA
jgi:hypothetical protein